MRSQKVGGGSGNSQRNYLSLSLCPRFVLLANELSYLSFTTFVTGAIETGFPRLPTIALFTRVSSMFLAMLFAKDVGHDSFEGEEHPPR